MDQPLTLSQTDGRPMYQQIIAQIRQRIAVGDWQPGLKLPSIRELAVATRVSVITVKRAYQELENDGVIMTQQGKGSFVADINDLGDRLKTEALDERLRETASTARRMGVGRDELVERLMRYFDEDPT